MPDYSGCLQRATVSIVAATVSFGLHLASVRAEVSGQAGAGTTIEMVEPKRLSPREITDRGIKFRAELDKAFNRLRDSEKAGHANELTAIALPYISAGMALDDAEGVLQAAGFTEPPRPSASGGQDRSRRADWYAVVAEIPQFAGRVFGPVDVFVMLLPPEQGIAEFAGRRHRMMYYPHP